MDINVELRNLMNLYLKRLEKLKNEIKEAKENDDIEQEISVELLQSQCRKMIAELYQTMKNIGILDIEEIKIGLIKK